MGEHIISAIFILVGVWMFKVFLNARRRIAASRLWVSTTGRIRDISIRERMRRGAADSHWLLRMIFEYEVGGKVYEGDQSRTRFSAGGGLFQTEALARQAMENLKARNPFTIYYDPEKPADCVLHIEESRSATKIAVMALVFLAIGFAILASIHWNEIAPLLQ